MLIESEAFPHIVHFLDYFLFRILAESDFLLEKIVKNQLESVSVIRGVKKDAFLDLTSWLFKLLIDHIDVTDDLISLFILSSISVLIKSK